MLFYVALIVAGVVAAAVIVWVARSFMMAGKTAYRSLSPGRNGEPKLARLQSNVGSTPAPWGWGNAGGATAATRINRYGPGGQSVAPSKSKDWSQLEVYARSNEKMARERHATSPHVGSVRNVLTGYDMQRSTKTDTSSWPYQDSLATGSSAVPVDNPTLTEKGNRPTKPWGW